MLANWHGRGALEAWSDTVRLEGSELAEVEDEGEQASVVVPSRPFLAPPSKAQATARQF